MALLELVKPRPDWAEALEVCLALPAGTPERRGGDDPWQPPSDGARPQRISDDLAWLRDAIEEPDGDGLLPTGARDSAAVGTWEPDAADSLERLHRLRDRGVLDAAGFLLHELDELELGA